MLKHKARGGHATPRRRQTNPYKAAGAARRQLRPRRVKKKYKIQLSLASVVATVTAAARRRRPLLGASQSSSWRRAAPSASQGSAGRGLAERPRVSAAADTRKIENRLKIGRSMSCVGLAVPRPSTRPAMPRHATPCPRLHTARGNTPLGTLQRGGHGGGGGGGSGSGGGGSRGSSSSIRPRVTAGPRGSGCGGAGSVSGRRGGGGTTCCRSPGSST